MTEKTLQVLLVEDNAGDVRLLREMFSKENPDSFNFTHFVRMKEAETFLAKGGVDIVLLDMRLPDGEGLDILRRARAVAPNVPIIVLTGLNDEVLAREAMEGGAQDYLIKGQIENRALPRALRHAIDRHRMQAETEQIGKQQLQLKDEFLSHVSHELRSPLASIYSFSTIIADGLAGVTSPEQNEYLKIILENVRQLQAMIEDLLQVTRVGNGQLNVELNSVSAVDVIAYAIATLNGEATSKELTLTSRTAPDLPMIYTDAIRLRQVLTILLDNAIKFTPLGGTVGVMASLSEKDTRFVQVEVVDSGCGIPAAVRDRVFEELYQVTNSSEAGRMGLGLGLHIAKGLVNSLGGKIWVESELGKGCDFFFTVPVFSLKTLIAPILAHEKKPGEVIAVLAVDIKTNVGSQPLSREVLSLARTLLLQCLRPDTDVLVRHPDSTVGHNLFFVAAYTQAPGAELIGKRILNQFRRNAQLQSDDFTFAVSHSFLDTVSRGVDESMESFAGRIACEIQDHINRKCRQGSV